MKRQTRNQRRIAELEREVALLAKHNAELHDIIAILKRDLASRPIFVTVQPPVQAPAPLPPVGPTFPQIVPYTPYVPTITPDPQPAMPRFVQEPPNNGPFYESFAGQMTRHSFDN